MRLVHLDMLRGLAALAVVVGHLRGFLFVDFGDLASPGLFIKAFYLLTSLGHEAVILFFALSGFLVGGAALQKMLAGNWSWPVYMVARLSRLWTVVIPALILTLLLDTLGRSMGGEGGYAGAYYGLLSSGPSPAQPADNSWLTMLANVAFLQTISAPVFGTNGPFWSLANEFWYYLVFPLAAAALLVPQSYWLRIVCASAALLLIAILPRELMVLGAIWVSGGLARYMAGLNGTARVFASRYYLIATMAIVTATILYPHLSNTSGTTLTQNLLLGGAWALVLPGLAALPQWGGGYAKIATALSEISYTLYATHYPLLAYVWFVALAPRQSPPGLSSFALASAMLAMTLFFAAIVWWCFERHTSFVRQATLKAFGLSSPRLKGLRDVKT